MTTSQNHPSGHRGEWPTRWSMGENAGWAMSKQSPKTGFGQRLDISCLCQNCSRRPPAEKTEKVSLPDRASCSPNDPVGHATEPERLNRTGQRVQEAAYPDLTAPTTTSLFTTWPTRTTQTMDKKKFSAVQRRFSHQGQAPLTTRRTFQDTFLHVCHGSSHS